MFPIIQAIPIILVLSQMLYRIKWLLCCLWFLPNADSWLGSVLEDQHLHTGICVSRFKVSLMLLDLREIWLYLQQV